MEQAQALQKMQVLTAQKNNLASQLQASWHCPFVGRSVRVSDPRCIGAEGHGLLHDVAEIKSRNGAPHAGRE